MERHLVSPQLANFANILYTKILWPVEEYQKELLTDNSYIFAPNHTNNLDGYMIWSLLAKDFDIDTFMYREFWDNFPFIAKFLPLFNVFPITRDKVVLKEILDELKKLQNYDHSLIIFPQGRHVDPEVMDYFKDYHLKTIPLGAFYMAMKSSKKLVPIYMEPQKLGKKNIVIYGRPISPCEFLDPALTKTKKERLIMFAEAWLNEMNHLYAMAKKLKGQELHKYKLEDNYTDASGLDYGMLDDPNRIMLFKDVIALINESGETSDFVDICELGKKLGVPDDVIKEIVKIKDVYEKRLIKHD